MVESPGAWTFDAGCITCSDVEEIPWRFRHPEVGRVCAIAQRLVVDDKLPKPDDLARHVRARLTGRVPEGHDTLTVFACLVDYVDGHPDEEDVDKIIDGVVELVRRQPLPLEARMADAASRLLRRLGERPPRSLRGFVPEALLHHPGGQGWGEIEAVLVRGDERLHLFMRSRDGFAEAFARTDHVSLSYGDDGPVNTVEKAMVARTMATAVERFLLGRPRDP